MKPHRFHPAALAEYRDAVIWYGLDRGERFAAAVEDAIGGICELPEAWPGWAGHAQVRRRVLRRYPYSVVYVVEPDELWIVAVAHHRRRPGYWLPRLRRRRLPPGLGS